ncbi:MAG: hypothetical protein J6B37_09010 [Clostridia bacterium]|nr:hypothetical protein [Clostridia bacterium]MBO5453158.1 hypothetical protein [Clostridia bacterium]
MKKKGLIITILVLIILIIASLITKYIDTANVSTGHEPECCIKIVSQDGGKVTYWGLGYKVVRYVGVSPDEPYKSNIGVKMGNWFMNYEKPTNVVLDVKSFRENKTFKVSDKADVEFITNLLKHSKYIDEPCDGIIDYAITYDDFAYDVLISCCEIRKGNKQAKISDKDMKELERILVTAGDKKRIYTYEESVEEMSKPYLMLDKENREFQFFWSMLSSYIAQGTYEVKDSEIICKTDDGNNVYIFEILEGKGYKFIESKSSKIPKYKYSGDAKEALAPVVDGAIFD